MWWKIRNSIYAVSVRCMLTSVTIGRNFNEYFPLYREMTMKGLMQIM